MHNEIRRLRDSAEKYRFLIEATNTGFVILDERGRVVDANNEYVRMTGHSRLEEIIGRPVTEWTAPHDLERNAAEVAKCRATGSVRNLVIDYLHTTGKLVPLEINATVLSGSPAPLIMSVCRDITERRQREEALRESERKYRDLFESLSDGLFILDLDGSFLDVNRTAYERLGYTKAELLALHISQLDPPEYASRVPERLALIRERGSAIFESAHLCKDGTVMPVEVNCRLLTYEGRTVYFSVIRDLRERKLLEEELVKTQKHDSIATLAGGIAHDFNNLLQGIFGYIAMAKLTIERQDKALAMLTQAEKALNRSVDLTAQLLTFSKGWVPVKRVTALPPLIENVVKFALSGSSVLPRLAIAADLRCVDVDEGQISQVIQNIVLNANQAMPLGGTVKIKALNLAGPAGDLVKISISDQGDGIPAEHLPRIFDPYFTTKEKGSGLGLATSYAIIRNHGGTLTVTSKPGKGATFTITLPAVTASASATVTPVAPVAPRGVKARILVMDDDLAVREVAGELLAAFGHEAVCVKDGESALRAYREAAESGHPFDMAILDLTIRGGMGGVETVRHLKVLDPAVRALASSGYSVEANAATCRDHGFHSFLSKPYTAEGLGWALQGVLKGEQR